jgi:hypothetical protein
MALNVYLEVQNLFGQAVPQPPQFALDRDDIGEVITPFQLTQLGEAEGIVLPTIGLVVDF